MGHCSSTKHLVAFSSPGSGLGRSTIQAACPGFSSNQREVMGGWKPTTHSRPAEGKPLPVKREAAQRGGKQKPGLQPVTVSKRSWCQLGLSLKCQLPLWKTSAHLVPEGPHSSKVALLVFCLQKGKIQKKRRLVTSMCKPWKCHPTPAAVQAGAVSPAASFLPAVIWSLRRNGHFCSWNPRPVLAQGCAHTSLHQAASPRGCLWDSRWALRSFSWPGEANCCERWLCCSQKPVHIKALVLV